MEKYIVQQKIVWIDNESKLLQYKNYFGGYLDVIQ